MDPQVIAAQQAQQGIVPGVGMSNMGMGGMGGMGMMDPYAQQAAPYSQTHAHEECRICLLGVLG